MENRFWVLRTAFVALLFARCTCAGPDTRSETIRLKVSVFNDAQVRPSVLSAAEARAKEVFEKAGVSLTWLDCGGPGHWHTELGCQDLAFPTHLSVRLVAGKQTASDHVFGQSFLNERGQGNYANVYLKPLSSAKALGLVREGDLLGYVVAHELGHLLLGENSHSAGGLMRVRWDTAELREAARGALVFSKTDSRRLRERYWSAAVRSEGNSSESRVSGK